MANPLAIEQKFQTLKQLLKLVSSKRLRILRIIEFVEELLTTPVFFPAYAQEIIPQLTKEIIGTDFTGTNLSCLERCIKMIERIKNDFPNSSNDVLFEQAQQHLKTESERIQNWIKSKNVGELNAHSHKKFDVGSIWIPMVEREKFLTALDPLFASLQRLSIDAVFSNKETDADKLHIKQLSHKEGESELLDTVEAARYLLSKFTHIKNGKRVTINCSFNNPTYVEGQSLQAGLAAGLFTELLQLHQHKEEYALRDDVAITGRIDKQANLLPVDEAGLKLKLEVCYFSHIKYLIVPKEQAEFCHAHLSLLTAQCSTLTTHNSPLTAQITSNNQCLEVIGISNLEELFYNRKLTDSRRITIAKQTIRKVWKLRRPIAAVLIVSLLLIIGKMLYGPLDKNPVDYYAEGETFFIKNHSGEVLDKIKVGTATIKHFNNTKKYFPSHSLVSFIDLDYDGLNEVIFTELIKDGGSIVYCKSLKLNKILWKFDVNRELVFPRNEVSSSLFCVNQIASGDFDNDGNPEIIILSLHNGLYPCLVYKLDALTGKELGNYLHIGSLYSFEIRDIDNNGISEILLTGVSNAYRIAVFTVLDPRLISGYSPLTQKYVVEKYEPAVEKAYITIPRTIVGKHYSLFNKSNCGMLLDIDEVKRVIRVTITDYEPANEPEKSADISAYFGFDLKIQTFMTHDLYDNLSRKLFEEGKITRDTDKEYFDEMNYPAASSGVSFTL